MVNAISMNKNISIFFGCLFVFLFLNEQIIGKYDDLIVGPLLSGKNEDWVCWLLFFLIEFTFVQFIFLYHQEQRITNFFYYGSMLLVVIYLYYRLFTEHYVYYYSSWAPQFKYADYFLIPLVGTIILGLLERLRGKQLPTYEKTPFSVDMPISHSVSDSFEREVFAAQMAKKIQSKIEGEYLGSLAIGITGSWGSGKTSFMNMIKQRITPHGRIVINFNPWRSASPGKIIENFFEELRAELLSYDRELSRDIAKYANSLTEIDDNQITRSIKAAAGYIWGEETGSVDYDGINASLTRINKQIIVFIDDLDRLEHLEIMEVLRIIRNTGSFGNFIYVVGYDRNYVSEGLKSLNHHNYQHYLDKIFQFEFKLPEIDALVLRNNVITSLRSSLGDGHQMLLTQAVDYVGQSGRCFTDRIIKTQRDVIRLSNAYLFEIDGVIGEVNLVDFYFIQLIKVRYPKVFEAVAIHKDFFFIREGAKMRLRLESDSNIQETDLGRLIWATQKIDKNKVEPANAEAQKNQAALIIYLSTLGEVLSKFDLDLLSEIINALLVEKGLRSEFQSADYKSFVYAANFEKYFIIRRDQSELSFAEFELLRLGEYEPYERKMQEWVGNDERRRELERRLGSIVDFETRIEWENQLNILIMLGKALFLKQGAFGINYKKIVETLSYPAVTKKSNFFKSEEAYKAFVLNFFELAPDPYLFEANVLSVVLNVESPSFPIPIKDIEQRLLSYFKDYCASHEEITFDFRALHNLIVKSDPTSYHSIGPAIREEAQKLFTQHFKTHLTACELGGFIHRHLDPDELYYMFTEDWISEIFGSLDNMIDFLKISPKIDRESDCYREFVKFYEKVKNSEYPAIVYRFDFLKKDDQDNELETDLPSD